MKKRNNSPLSIEASFCESHPVANNALLLLLAMKSFCFQLVTVSMDSET